ncbi:PAS domain-containing protein [Bradyrhizobium tropiciagri]|uniref:PAS domain-containing sensor histidine kinase n=1 Tax=Bradyrhizobium tropiciagri TaxID=312253 RepID=UPI001BA6B4C9|nr:PAS domain-containing sensor histidine kinase [Bradyrhizobium tropiciagri]MBR0875061.1 PAS domain-containing protein [Bradyrhizobium tropiciagri]
MLVNGENPADAERFGRFVGGATRILALRAASLDDLPEVLDILVDALALDFVYLRFKDPISREPVEMERSPRGQHRAVGLQEISRALRDWLGADLQRWHSNARIAVNGIGISIFPQRLTMQDDTAVFVAASRRMNFPEETESLLLHVAANQALIGLQRSWLSSDRKRAADIVDQKAANFELSKEIAELRRMVQSQRLRELDIQLVVDAIATPTAIMTPAGEVEAVNQAVLEYFGLPVEELKHWKTTDVVHPADLDHTIEVWRRGVGAGQSYEVESRHRRSDGIYRWFHVKGFPLRDSQGRIVRWCVLQIDIEDRKRAEEALRASERNLRLIISTIPGQVWSARPDGWADFFNQHFLNYAGLSSEQSEGWGWTDAVHPEDRSGLNEAWRSIRAARQAGEKEARLRRFDGTYRWFLLRANPLRDEAGAVIKWFGVNTDIEDRKRAEEELRDTQGKLAHMARVITMGELTASIAHEVNQPLSGILTNANTCLRMLAADPPNIAGARETVRRTIRDGNRASEIIVRLRSLFSGRAPVFRPINLNAATNEVVALVLARLRRDAIRLRTELAEALPLIMGDRVQLQQVILNLLQNAADAMSAIDDRPRELVIETERGEGNWVRLSVRDSGAGFDPDAMERLFDAFHTTKGDGMGIGLSVSRSIIANHHGRLWAELNKDGPGATFRFSIPRLTEGAAGIDGSDGNEAPGGDILRNE